MTPEPSSSTAAPAAHPAESKPLAKSHRWHEHVPRTTAALAVIAAISSGQYTSEFSRTILAQAEVTDQWSFYQAKKIKQHLTQNQVDLAHAFSVGRPDVAAQLADFEQKNVALAKKYDSDLATIQASAKSAEAEKTRHQQEGDRFQIAFIILQAGVVLSTVAASAKRRELWIFAIACGVAGLLVVGDAYLLVDLKFRHPATTSGTSAASGGG